MLEGLCRAAHCVRVNRHDVQRRLESRDRSFKAGRLPHVDTKITELQFGRFISTRVSHHRTCHSYRISEDPVILMRRSGQFSPNSDSIQEFTAGPRLFFQ